MQISVPHRVIYETPDLVPVSQVVESLLGIERIFLSLGPLVEGCFPGLAVDKIEVSVREISQASPLRELLFATLIITYQDDLVKEVPPLINELLGTSIPHNYDTIVTVLFCLLVFYGVDFAYQRTVGASKNGKIKKQLRGLIKDVAVRLDVKESAIRKTLEDKYSKSIGRSLAEAALQVFKPSKQQNNTPLLIGNRRIDRETVEEVPGDAQLSENTPLVDSAPIQNVEIELHAQDVDRPNSGWAAVIPVISKNRLPLKIYPPLTPAQIYTKSKVRGDVILISRSSHDGSMQPHSIHLISLRE